MLVAIFKNILKPGFFSVILKKVFYRAEKNTAKAAYAWACENATENLEDFCLRVDSNLWAETLAVCEKIESTSRELLKMVPISLGGGGSYPLLYFYVRKNKPKFNLETGVAAGWSSEAILSALKKNGGGNLFSSDFPYFRIENPEQYIGLLVSEENKSIWELDIRGDEKALPSFISRLEGEKIQLFHYDSDKSYSGRQFALDSVIKSFSPDGILIMDDIQDNLFFRDFVLSKNLIYKVFEFEGKYVGVVMNIGEQLESKRPQIA